jgi:hypothetical protein
VCAASEWCWCRRCCRALLLLQPLQLRSRLVG